MKKLLRWILVLLLVLFVVLSINTLMAKSRQIQVPSVEPAQLDDAGAVQRFSSALRIQTVTYDDPAKLNVQEFQAFQSTLEQSFPLVHAHLSREIVSGHSLLYRWQGQKDDSPVVVMGHFDVVPADATTWKHPPFSGEIVNGYVWGRGTLDDKSNVTAELEAVEFLLQKGFNPPQTIYLAFGHDEEGGGKGAAAIVDLLSSRGVKPDMVLDEGGAILDAMVPGVRVPVAMIGTSEKGYLTLDLTVEDPGGHSSSPPAHTAIGVVSEAIKKLEDHPLPAHLEGSAEQMLDYLAPELPFIARFFLVNRWLFEPLIVQVMKTDQSVSPLLRTTTAATMIQGGVKENVLPAKAVATVNFRIRPGETRDSVIEFVRKTIGSERVKITVRPAGMEPSPVSPADSKQFLLIQRTIREIFPSTVVVPGLVIGATDARHYSKICNNVFRFSPYIVKDEDLHGYHGIDEKLSVENYIRMIRFYIRFLQNLRGP